MNIHYRRLWLRVHRWLGLTAGLVLVVIGISGSLLVFHRQIDPWLNPRLLRVEPGGARQTLSVVLTAAEALAAARSERMLFAEPPESAKSVWAIWFQPASTEASGFIQVYVDPYSGQVTGQRIWGEYATTWMYRLHCHLLAGVTGETVVGILGLIFLVSLGSGIVLWWPLWRHSLRAAFAIRWGRLFAFDLHKTLGVFSVLLLTVSALTGVYLVFPQWIQPSILMVSAESVPNASKLRSDCIGEQHPIDADRAVAIAQSVFVDGTLKRMQFPSGPEGTYIARVRRPTDVRSTSGNSRIWIDQYSGEVLAVRDWNERTAADTFFAWQFPLHNGEAFGLAGRWLMFVAGLIPAILYGTGFYLWLRRRRGSRKLRPAKGT